MPKVRILASTVRRIFDLPELLFSPPPALPRRVKDRTRTQLQRLASFLQATQPFFQQLQPEVIRDVRSPV